MCHASYKTNWLRLADQLISRVHFHLRFITITNHLGRIDRMTYDWNIADLLYEGQGWINVHNLRGISFSITRYQIISSQIIGLDISHQETKKWVDRYACGCCFSLDSFVPVFLFPFFVVAFISCVFDEPPRIWELRKIAGDSGVRMSYEYFMLLVDKHGNFIHNLRLLQSCSLRQEILANIANHA